jgi:citrate lyase subunit beta/citryl-CoA lyase
MSRFAATRSFLFVPATRLDRVSNAQAAGADAVIIDLEDGVPPEHKQAARRKLLAYEGTGLPTLIRVNACATSWFAGDMETIRELGAYIDGVVIPKADTTDGLAAVAGLLTGNQEIIALVETAHAVTRLDEICHAPGVTRLAFGALDFSLDSGVSDDGSLTSVRVEIAVRSRAAGLPPPVDGISTEVHDLSMVSTDAAHAKTMGFGGKLCIHPRQIDAVHTVFTPSDEEMRWATSIANAASGHGEQPFLFRGQMVDLPVLEQARRLLKHGQGQHLS